MHGSLDFVSVRVAKGAKNCDFDYGHPKVKQPKRCKIANLKP